LFRLLEVLSDYAAAVSKAKVDTAPFFKGNSGGGRKYKRFLDKTVWE